LCEVGQQRILGEVLQQYSTSCVTTAFSHREREVHKTPASRHRIRKRSILESTQHFANLRSQRRVAGRALVVHILKEPRKLAIQRRRQHAAAPSASNQTKAHICQRATSCSVFGSAPHSNVSAKTSKAYTSHFSGSQVPDTISGAMQSIPLSRQRSAPTACPSSPGLSRSQNRPAKQVLGRRRRETG
jgi:hypothetical protein